MALSMQAAVTLRVARPVVWAGLNDPAILKGAIPGCQSLEKTSDSSFAAVVQVKIGPVKATFRGAVELSDLTELVSYRITGKGDAGLAGAASGGAFVTLSDAAEGCLLTYTVNATIGGKIAQLGSRLIDGVASKLADQFFANFVALLEGGETTLPTEAAS